MEPLLLNDQVPHFTFHLSLIAPVTMWCTHPVQPVKFHCLYSYMSSYCTGSYVLHATHHVTVEDIRGRYTQLGPAPQGICRGWCLASVKWVLGWKCAACRVVVVPTGLLLRPLLFCHCLRPRHPLPLASLWCRAVWVIEWSKSAQRGTRKVLWTAKQPSLMKEGLPVLPQPLQTAALAKPQLWCTLGNRAPAASTGHF